MSLIHYTYIAKKKLNPLLQIYLHPLFGRLAGKSIVGMLQGGRVDRNGIGIGTLRKMIDKKQIFLTVFVEIQTA
jgi:hypothetical protein